MDAEFVAYFSGALISLLAEYAPFIKDWYKKIPAKYKRLVMAGVALVPVYAGLLLSCFELETFFTCDKFGVYEASKLYGRVLLSNQFTYFMIIDPLTKE